jgi:GAF domain-containing protein/HAMP domain-containing protein
MTNLRLEQQSIEESTISRQTRNAFTAAIALTLAALVNLAGSLRISLQSETLISSLDTVVVAIFAVIALISAVIIRKGKREKGVWLLLISFVVTIAFRNAFTSGLGIVFGVLPATLVPFIGLLTLKQEKFNYTLGLGIFSGSFYIIFDILASNYLPPYRQSIENIPIMATIITIMAIIVALIFVVALYKQHRFLLISSKITLAMVFFVLMPVIILSAVQTTPLVQFLENQQKENMRIKVSFIANSIDELIELNKATVEADSQIPIFTEYLLSLDDTQNIETSRIEKQALESLRSIRRKDLSDINSYAILDINGKNVLDTSAANHGQDESETDYFIQAKTTGGSFVSDITRDSSGEYFFYFSAPIYNFDTNEIVGVIRSKYRASALQQFIDNYINIEETSDKQVFAALLTEVNVTPLDEDDPESVYLVMRNSKDPDINFKSITRLTTNIITPLQMAHFLPAGSTAQLSLDVPGLDQGLRQRTTEPVFAAQAFPSETPFSTYTDIVATANIEEPSLPWIILISQDINSFNAPITKQQQRNAIIAVLIAVSTAVFAYFGSQYLLSPLPRLTATANEVAEGDHEARAIVNSQDEIGLLGNAFNSMADQLNNLIKTLEEQVAERTQALERSTEQLHAAAIIGNKAASLHNLDELLSQATELISEKFGFYHAGIFFVDSYRKYAVLKAANSAGGQRMLARGHKLEVGAEGIVGYVTATGEARIALDVGQDAVFFNNPDLPATRSEMALPLIAGGKILGALDIQSTKGEAFSEADITTLQVLADQIAIAIENARLFEEGRKALATVQRAYGEQSHLSWKDLIHREKKYGYRSGGDNNIYLIQDKDLDSTLKQVVEKNQTTLEKNDLIADIPITVRGKPVGAIRLAKPDYATAWTEHDINLAKTLTEELSQAMESARLFDETKRQADRERVIGEITNRMQATMNVESVIRLAADEFYSLLDLDQVTIHLNAEENEENEEEIA